MPISTAAALVDNYVFTDHATARMDNRLISRDTVNCILTHADRYVPAGGGVLAVSLSRRRLAALRHEGLAAAVIERAAKVVVLIDGDRPVVITVLRDHGEEGRRYRRLIKSQPPSAAALH